MGRQPLANFSSEARVHRGDYSLLYESLGMAISYGITSVGSSVDTVTASRPSGYSCSHGSIVSLSGGFSRVSVHGEAGGEKVYTGLVCFFFFLGSAW